MQTENKLIKAMKSWKYESPPADLDRRAAAPAYAIV